MLQYLIIGIVIFGLIFAPSFSMVIAEQNKSSSKQRPQADEIKAKLATKALAIEQRRQADAIIAKNMHENKKTAQNDVKPPSREDSIKMQYKLFVDAKHQKKLELQIRSDILKKDIKKKFQIDKLIESGKIKLHSKEKPQIEYGRTK